MDLNNERYYDHDITSSMMSPFKKSVVNKNIDQNFTENTQRDQEANDEKRHNDVNDKNVSKRSKGYKTCSKFISRKTSGYHRSGIICIFILQTHPFIHVLHTTGHESYSSSFNGEHL